MDKIKVVLICSFSNAETRSIIKTKIPWLIKTIGGIKDPNYGSEADNAVWNTNALREIPKFSQIEVHVIAPIRYMVEKSVEYEKDGIYYNFFRDQHSSTLRWLTFQTITKYSCEFKINRRFIKNKIAEIKPQIVHLVGAENPYFSTSILDVPDNICTIAQLQALLCSIEDSPKLRPNERLQCHKKGILEKLIFNKVDYIGTTVDSFKSFINKEVNPNVKYLPISLAVAQEVDLNNYEKKYDFVYFAVNIEKAGDDAIEAFALALKQIPTLTLDVVGGYNDDFKGKLDARIAEHGIGDSITFEGFQQSHDDVIKQIKKSHFALLPLRNDIVPSTIREAMANGLPIVTSVTEGTPELNAKAECVLLSDYMDFQTMANNMVRLVKDSELAERLRQNGASYMRGKYNNYDIVAKWVDCYEMCVKEKYGNKQI